MSDFDAWSWFGARLFLAAAVVAVAMLALPLVVLALS